MDIVIVIGSALWMMCGLGVGAVMSRRGHDAPSWILVGLATGPFALALARTERRR